MGNEPSNINPTIGLIQIPNTIDNSIQDYLEKNNSNIINLDIESNLNYSKIFNTINGILLIYDFIENYNNNIEVKLKKFLTKCIETNIPILCTGNALHILNYCLNGLKPISTPSHSLDNNKSSYHRIFIPPGSKLAAILGSGGFVRVNSRHSYSITEVQKSSDLIASAYSLDDGIIEAIESPENIFIIAVQFNPERRGEIPPHFDKLFTSFIKACKKAQKGVY